jgi:hypothetical protein
VLSPYIDDRSQDNKNSVFNITTSPILYNQSIIDVRPSHILEATKQRSITRERASRAGKIFAIAENKRTSLGGRSHSAVNLKICTVPPIETKDLYPDVYSSAHSTTRNGSC